MSKLVALSTNQDVPAGIFGVATIDAEDFPSTPSQLIFKDEVYSPAAAYGQPVPGHPEISDVYFKTDSLVVDPAQVKPFVP